MVREPPPPSLFLLVIHFEKFAIITPRENFYFEGTFIFAIAMYSLEKVSKQLGEEDARTIIKTALDVSMSRKLEMKFNKDGIKKRRTFVKTTFYKISIEIFFKFLSIGSS